MIGNVLPHRGLSISPNGVEDASPVDTPLINMVEFGLIFADPVAGPNGYPPNSEERAHTGGQRRHGMDPNVLTSEIRRAYDAVASHPS